MRDQADHPASRHPQAAIEFEAEGLHSDLGLRVCAPSAVSAYQLKVVDAERGEPAREAAEHDDAGAVRLRERRVEERREREVAEHVGGEHELVSARIRLAFRRRMHHPGILDECVDVSSSRKHVGGSTNRLRVCDIEFEQFDAGTRDAPADGGHRRVAPFAAAACEHDMGSGRGELLAREVADSAIGAGDDDDLSGLVGQRGGRAGHDARSSAVDPAMRSWWWMTSAMMKLRNFSANAGSR